MCYIRNKCIHKKLEIASIEDEMRENLYDGLGMSNKDK